MNGSGDREECVSKLAYWPSRPKPFSLLGKSRQKYDTKSSPNLASL